MKKICLLLLITSITLSSCVYEGLKSLYGDEWIEEHTPYYIIKFDSNGGSGIMDDLLININTTRSLPNCRFTPPVGMKFSNWYDDNGNNYSANTIVSDLTNENGSIIILYANWINKPEHSIIYNNIKNADNSVNKQTFYESESVKLLPISLPGYDFICWEDSLGNTITEWSAGEMQRNVTVYARLKAHSYNIFFDSGIGNGDMNGKTLYYGQALELPSCTFEPPVGMIFSHWKQMNDNLEYGNREVVSDMTTDDGAVITLFAQYEVMKYQIKFDANGGIGYMNNQILYKDKESNLSTNLFTSDNHTFLGWSLRKQNVPDYIDGQSVSNLTNIQGDVITLYAVWKEGVACSCEDIIANDYCFPISSGTIIITDTSPDLIVIKEALKSTRININLDLSSCTNLNEIGENAFDKCIKLTDITLPKNIKNIGNKAFCECSGLTSIIIPDSTMSIGDCAFLKCSGLTSVILSNGITNIGRYAFYGCGGLNSITIPNSVTSIEEGVFSHSGLGNIVIPDSVINIGESAFDNCYVLSDLTIGSSVQTIGAYAFSSCYSLGLIIIKAKNPPSLGKSTFDTGVTRAVYVPLESVDIYRNADGWYNFQIYAIEE